MEWLARKLSAMEARISELERRLENSHRKGKVVEVDPKRGLARLEVGVAADGTPQKGPWVKYSQQMGKLKIHTAPSVGQTMMQVAPGGDFEQAFLIPLGASDSNASPGEGEDPVVSYGDTKITIGEDGPLIESKTARVQVTQKADVLGPRINVEAEQSLRLRGGQTVFELGNGATLTGGIIDFQTDRVLHRGTNIGDDHVHGGVQPGGADTLEPH